MRNKKSRKAAKPRRFPWAVAVSRLEKEIALPPAAVRNDIGRFFVVHMDDCFQKALNCSIGIFESSLNAFQSQEINSIWIKIFLNGLAP
jgi:hypothetical protein